MDKAKSEIRVCPDCGKAFYSFTNVPFRCPNCGFTLKERRGGDRKPAVLPFSLKVGSSDFFAELLDYSDTGVRLACPRGLETDTLVSIRIHSLNLNRSARAVWTKWVSPSLAVTGLEFTKEPRWSA